MGDQDPVTVTMPALAENSAARKVGKYSGQTDKLVLNMHFLLHIENH